VAFQAGTWTAMAAATDSSPLPILLSLAPVPVVSAVSRRCAVVVEEAPAAEAEAVEQQAPSSPAIYAPGPCPPPPSSTSCSSTEPPALPAPVLHPLSST
jgi:hypothetical protein